jgi:outer membrane protein assembly factor BamB
VGTIQTVVLRRPSRQTQEMRILFVVAVIILLTACTGGSGDSGRFSSSSPASTVPAPASVTSSGQAARTYPDWPTYHGDAARSGVSASMPTVTGALTVKYTLTLGGAVYASPIVVGGITIVATEQDDVFGLDAAGHQLWRTDLGTPAARSQLPCGDIDPLGITGTPVYDEATRLIYLVAEYGSPPRHELVAVSPADGSVSWRVSVDLPGVDAAAMQERGALTVTGGSVWVPFGGLAGDCGAYKGRVVGIPLTGSHAPSAFTVPTAREGGIWTPPGPSVDAAGHLVVSVGNGESGVGDSYDHSDSVLQLDGTTMADSFSPTSWATDNDADKDLGSQGPALVGDQWIFIAGKSGTAYVLRQGHLGGIGGQVSSAHICTSFGGAAVSGTTVYVPCTDGIRAVQITATGQTQVIWHATSDVTGSPVVGGGRVWSLDPAKGVLYALDPATGRSLGKVSVGAASRFATPAISGPDVLVPTLAGLAAVRTS